MTGALAAAVLVTALGVGGWRLWAVHRDLARLRASLDARTDARVDAHLVAIWRQLGQLQGQHARTVEARVQRAETAAAQIANGHRRLDQRLLTLDDRLVTVEAWVGHWSGQAGR